MFTELIWKASRHLGVRGHTRAAKATKALNFLLNRALLPYQAEVGRGVTLEHHGLAVVIHPNVTIGDGVKLWHGITLAAETAPGSATRIYVGDNVVIGAQSVVIARHDESLTIGAGAVIGAGSVVTRDVASGDTVAGPYACTILQQKERQ